MSDRTVIENVTKQINELTTKKAQQLEVIQAELSKARTSKAAADEAATAAAAEMDLDAWNRAAEDKKAAEMAENMFSSRLAQIAGKEMISEEESDRVIDSLRGYIKDLDNAFDAALGKILRDLRILYDGHISDIREAESVIRTWTNDIHKNYRSYTSLYFDPETGTRSNRSPHPVPVNLTDGQGGGHARMVRQFLSNFQTLLSDPEEETDE